MDKQNLTAAKRYYEKINLGEFDEEYFGLFDEKVEIWYPKTGYLYGREGLAALGSVIQNAVQSLQFELEKFVYTAGNSRVAVEIVEHGVLKNGTPFPNGRNTFGKFCNVFEFADGKIVRMHCYGDPDFAGLDGERAALFKP